MSAQCTSLCQCSALVSSVLCIGKQKQKQASKANSCLSEPSTQVVSVRATTKCSPAHTSTKARQMKRRKDTGGRMMLDNGHVPQVRQARPPHHSRGESESANASHITTHHSNTQLQSAAASPLEICQSRPSLAWQRRVTRV